MSPPEIPRYLISGEVSQEDWTLALQLLGRLGIGAVPVNSDEQSDGDIKVTVSEALEPGTIPYTLDEITSREQYLANEHLGEFWPEYRRSFYGTGKSPNKHYSLCWGLNMLAHPKPKGKPYCVPEAHIAQYAEQLGIKVVKPRSQAGFSDKYAPTAYGLWDHIEYGDVVIEIGSFINATRVLAVTPVDERPWGINASVIRFFTALADKLEAQIKATSIDQ